MPSDRTRRGAALSCGYAARLLNRRIARFPLFLDAVLRSNKIPSPGHIWMHMSSDNR